MQSLQRELSLLLRRARALSGEIAREVHPGLDGVSYVLLRTIADTGPMRAQDLVALYGVDKSAISRQVRRLEQLGLLERSSDSGDGRALLLVPTREGARRLERARSARHVRLRSRLAGWAGADVAALGALLQRFNDEYADVTAEQLRTDGARGRELDPEGQHPAGAMVVADNRLPPATGWDDEGRRHGTDDDRSAGHDG